MENYTAYLEYTDAQIGRVVDAVDARGDMDNTLIIYIVGDNGASAEGGLEGTVNEVASLNGIQLGLAGLLEKFDQIGGPETEPHVPVAWAWAANTPFQWTKQIASHLGGTRNPMVISWPKRITDAGGLRSQFHHLIDIAPTLLEAVGIPEPQVVNGVAQKSIEGVSMVYTFDSAAASDRRTRSVLRDVGEPGDLQGRLDGSDAARHPMDDRRPGDRLRRGRVGALPPGDGFFPGHQRRGRASRKGSRSCRPSSTSRPASITSFRSTIGLRSASTQRCGRTR